MTFYCIGCGRTRSQLWGDCTCGVAEGTIEYLELVEEQETIMKTRKKLPPNKPVMPPKKKGC